MTAQPFPGSGRGGGLPSSYGGSAAADQYLIQRINGASVEQLAALLLEGAQRFLGQAMIAMEKKDVPSKARLINRVSSIIEELAVWVDHEQGGELAENLTRIYDWWINELFDGSQSNQVARLQFIHRQMGEMRSTWLELDQKKRGQSQATTAISGDGVVG